MPKKQAYEPGWKTVEVASLRKAPWNYKEENDATMAKLVANFERNAQVENIIIRPINDANTEFEVVNGNHRLEAMQKLGITQAFCFDIGIVTEAHAMRIAVETNETKFPVNPVRLSEIVAALVKESGVDSLVNSMPFSKDQIEGMDLLAEAKGDPKQRKAKKILIYSVVCEHCGKKHFTDQHGQPLDDDSLESPDAGDASMELVDEPLAEDVE